MTKGEGKSNNELRDIAKNIFNDSVPKVWKIYSTLELNVTEWILDFKNRISQLNKITQEGDYGRSGIWLGGLIFPEGYLTAIKQSVAQELKVSLDKLVLSVEFVKNNAIFDATSFTVEGLSIEGAEWNYDEDKLSMTDSLFSQLPPCLFKWGLNKDDNMKNVFPIPVYLNNMRQNLLFSVFIKNESFLSDSDWYQRGIALISWNKTYKYNNDNGQRILDHSYTSEEKTFSIEGERIKYLHYDYYQSGATNVIFYLTESGNVYVNEFLALGTSIDRMGIFNKMNYSNVKDLVIVDNENYGKEIDDISHKIDYKKYYVYALIDE